MNKKAIKDFAIWARKKLINDISYKARLLGITEQAIKPPMSQTLKDGVLYDSGTATPTLVTMSEAAQRERLAEVITTRAEQADYTTAYQAVMEEIAYTWFNRLIAIRFMEVNDYLPTHVRVLSAESGKREPDLVTQAMEVVASEQWAVDRDKLFQLKNDNQHDAVFRILFIAQCNALHEILPQLFEKVDDYTELLLNVSYTDSDDVVYHLVHDIPEEDFNIQNGGQIEIIGWLYQYYNTELKDETFALLKKNVKITKERVPSATQLFTPDWIVRYMVENSLGRLWLEGHPNDELKAHWKYYLEEAEQEADVQSQLEQLRAEYKHLKPEEIKIIDPCMGSGHILVYAFDVLMQIYESAGYGQRDAAKSILENNLYGLDIDKRAYQLAYFAVLMKARQYNRRILNSDTICHLHAFEDSYGLKRGQLNYFGATLSELEKNDAINQMNGLLDTFIEAKEYGSIMHIEDYNWPLLQQFASQFDENGQMSIDAFGLEETQEKLQMIVAIGQTMTRRYDVVVTNPPYMGSSGMGAKLADYVKKNYPDTKSDMSTVCMEKTIDMCKQRGYMAMINIPVWMFLSSYEKLRKSIVSHNTIISMLHLGRGIFGSDFGTTTFVIAKRHINGFKGEYRRLYEKQGAVDSPETKKKWFFEGKGSFSANQENFTKIPGTPIAYWVAARYFEIFLKPNLKQFAFAGIGMRTGDNDRFLRLWHEVSRRKLFTDCVSARDALEKHAKWVPYNKGGNFRRWYGNNEYVVNWENDGYEIKENTRKVYPQLENNLGWKISNEQYYFREGITWTVISSKYTSFRRYYAGSIISNSGQAVISDNSNLLNYLVALFNTNLVASILAILSPTIGFESGYINKIPVIIDEAWAPYVEELSNKCISLSQSDWDAFETSWDFVRHPLVPSAQERGEQLDSQFATSRREKFGRLSWHYENWERECADRFNQLKANEEELNRIFIDIYGLQDELTPEVEDKDVTVGRDIRSLISYAVGCMFGRYSLDGDGLAYAGGQWDGGKYSTFIPDADNIIPITDEAYLEDDIVGLLCAWLKKVYGPETLEENLAFIAKALGNKGNTAREVIRNYFLKDFFKDHCKIYQKRPIYWLFDSGKQNGFKALIYLHRYDENTIGNLRIDYLHRMQRIYENEMERMQETIDNSQNGREIAQATKRKEKLQKQLKECREYDEKISHLALARIPLDLDDGVKVNYEKVQTVSGKTYQVLAKI